MAGAGKKATLKSKQTTIKNNPLTSYPSYKPLGVINTHRIKLISITIARPTNVPPSGG